MAKTTKKTKAKAKAEPAAKKPQTSAKPQTSTKPGAKATTSILRIPAVKQAKQPTAKRPAVNPAIPQQALDSVASDIESAKATLEEYSAHLRALDRKRLNGVGMKKLGFIQEAYDLALANPEFLPHYLTTDKFTEDHQLFLSLRSLFEQTKQVLEIEWNLVITAADMDYTDALEFYSSVKEAAKRRVDAAETLYRTLEIHFKRQKPADKPETEKEFLRDAKAYFRGKKDGKLEIENISPKLTGGVHKVIDEKFQDTAKFREDVEGEIKE
jgi:hypothetical protein